MRTLTVGLCLALAVSMTSAAPLLTAYRTTAPPTLDGHLSDPCWAGASVTSQFLSADGPGLPDEQTQVRACFDDANLYLGVEAFDAFLDPVLNMMEAVKADASGRDANVFRDDCIEMFFEPPDAGDFQFAANSGDGTWEARDTDAAWNGQWQCTTSRGPKSYILEIAIPLSSLDAKPEGAWPVNFARERTAVDENSTWCGMQGAFHQPELFGTLAFAETGPALGPVSFSREGNEYRFEVDLSGAADDATGFEATVAADKRSESASANGPGAHQFTVPLPKGAFDLGKLDLGWTLRQGDTELVRSATITEALSAAVAQLSLRTKEAQARVFVNGKRVAIGDEPTTLQLDEGLSILAVQADRRGDAPGVAVTVTSAGREVGPGWVCRADDPDDAWDTSLPAEGWTPPHTTKGMMWPEAEGQRVWFVRGLYVGDAGPQLFPKMDRFYLSRGSSQLMRFYLHAPMEIPSVDYAMVVEAPAALKYVAVEPVSGGSPEVVTTPATADNGRKMARHEVRYGMPPYPGFDISLRWGDEGESTLAYAPSITGGGTFDWRHMSLEVTAPEGAHSVHPLIIKWQNRGIVGTFWIDNLVFREKGSDENLLKMGTFDEPEWGSHYQFKREGPDGSICVKMVSTPDNADKQMARWVDKEDVVPVQAGRTYVVECDARTENLGSPSAKPLAGLLFAGPARMPEGDYPVYTYFTALDGLVTELPHRSRAVILPPLKNKQPKLARICPCYYGSRFRSDEVGRAYAESCWASGITWTYGRTENNVVPHLLDRGHKVIWSIGWHPYSPRGTARELLEEHEDLQAMDFAGKRIPGRFCPTWLLTEGDAALDELEAWLLETVNREPYTGADWDLEDPVIDPPTYCTCDRCLEAFREFAKLPADTEITTDQLLDEYRDRWVDFRCGQNAEMAGRLRDMLHKADRPIEFSVYSGFQSKRTREHYGVDWSMMAPMLDWGIAGYSGNRQVIYDTVEALGDVPFMGTSPRAWSVVISVSAGSFANSRKASRQRSHVQ